MKVRHTLSLLLGMTVLAPMAGASIVYVDRDAPGPTLDGTSWATAYLTVTDGLTSAADGDEVWVAVGLYNESVTIQSRISLYGGFSGTETSRDQRDWKANSTIVHSQEYQRVLDCQSPGITVDGFTLRGSGSRIGQDATVTLAHNTISSGIGISGIVTLTGNHIEGSSYYGVSVYNAATLVNNIITGNVGGVEVTGTATLTGNTIHGNGNGVDSRGVVLLTNNSIVANNTDGVRVSGGTATLTNNIVAFNVGYDLFTEGVGAIAAFSANDVYGNITGEYSGFTPPAGQDNLSLDPLFVDRANKNYHLLAGSPCIDAGDDSLVAPGATDLDGKPRIIGACVDIGAYEYGPVGPPPFTLADVAKCLGISCGLVFGTSEEVEHLNVETGNPWLDMLDAARIARKVAGLDANT